MWPIESPSKWTTSTLWICIWNQLDCEFSTEQTYIFIKLSFPFWCYITATLDCSENSWNFMNLKEFFQTNQLRLSPENKSLALIDGMNLSKHVCVATILSRSKDQIMIFLLEQKSFSKIEITKSIVVLYVFMGIFRLRCANQIRIFLRWAWFFKR